MATGGPGCAVAGQRKSDRLRDGAVAFLSAFKDGYDKHFAGALQHLSQCHAIHQQPPSIKLIG